MSFFRFLVRFGLGGILSTRSVLAMDFVVTQSGDSALPGSDTLRSEIAAANANPGPDRVWIRTPDPIVLTNGPILVTDSVEIIGARPEGASRIAGNGDSGNRASLLQLHGDPEAPREIQLVLRKLHLRAASGPTLQGGGVDVRRAHLRVEECLFTDNSTLSEGSAIRIEDAVADVRDSVFESNVASGSGAIAALGSELTVVRSRFSGNRSFTGGAIAGGMASIDIVDSLIRDNSADFYGGGVLLMNGKRLRIQRSTVVGNTAGSYGGGVALYGPDDGEPSVIENSTIAGNAAPAVNGSGAGVFFGSGRLHLRNSTVVANRTGPGDFNQWSNGGGVFVGGSGSRLEISSTILAGNTQEPAAASDLVRDLDPRVTPPGIVSVRRSLVQAVPETGTVNGAEADNLWQVDPKLEPLADNGGPTPTMALTLGSPACERGENAAGLASDQRGDGFPRAYGNTDIGAYEYHDDVIFQGGFERHDPGALGCARQPPGRSVISRKGGIPWRGGALGLVRFLSGTLLEPAGTPFVERTFRPAPQGPAKPDGGWRLRGGSPGMAGDVRHQRAGEVHLA